MEALSFRVVPFLVFRLFYALRLIPPVPLPSSSLSVLPLLPLSVPPLVGGWMGFILCRLIYIVLSFNADSICFSVLLCGGVV